MSGILLRLEVTLDEAETLEEALYAYRQEVISMVEGEPTLLQRHAINTAETIGRALEASLEKHKALAKKPPGYAPKRKHGRPRAAQ